MPPRWKKILRRVLITSVVLWLLAVLFAHPFFAVVEPSGSKVLVAEGWMHTEGLKEAAKLFARNGYERMCITGPPRPFAYYLAVGDTIEVRFAEPTTAALIIGTAGLPGASWQVQLDSIPFITTAVNGAMTDTELKLNHVGTARITATSPDPPASGEPVLFIGSLLVGGRNAHLINATIRIRRADGSTVEGQPTFAHQAYYILQNLGVPPDRMTVIPTWVVKDSRTLSTARDLVAYADVNGITSFDVATLGVHARRTRNMYRKARGTDAGIGIIALHDKWCQRWTWWTNYYGWYQVLKESVALPAPWLIDDSTEARK